MNFRTSNSEYGSFPSQTSVSKGGTSKAGENTLTQSQVYSNSRGGMKSHQIASYGPPEINSNKTKENYDMIQSGPRSTNLGSYSAYPTSTSIASQPITNSLTSKTQSYQPKDLVSSNLVSSKNTGGRVFESRTEKIKGGLPNLGYTCYINAVLQCLFNLNRIMNFFENGEHLQIAEYEKQNTEMCDAFTQLYLDKKSAPSASELVDSVASFKIKVETLSPNFQGIRQNDAHEFLRLLLDGLHNEISQPSSASNNQFAYNRKLGTKDNYENWKQLVAFKDNSFIYNLFGGVLYNIISCPICASSSENFESFLDLSLPMKKDRVYYTSLDIVDIDACFKEYFKEEVIEGFACDKCKRKVSATRKTKVYKAPNILVMHLKRFEFLKYSGKKEKIESKVKTKIANFTIPKIYCYDSSPIYNLSGIVNHYGTISGGHYTANAYDFSKETFMEYDDAVVTPISLSIMKSEYETKGSDAPYLYFYYKA